MTEAERDRFDQLVEDAIEALPPRIRALLDEIPVVVLDEPDDQMMRELGLDPADGEARGELCGMHTGTSLTERSVERSGDLPTQVHLFRRGIIALAGGWEAREEKDEEGRPWTVGGDDEIYEEIRVTLLHEIGHHFGLDEDDLERLGYD